MQYYVYLLSNKKYGTLYIGVTSNLIKRIWEHRNDAVKGFSQKYKLHKLIYYESTESIESAIV
ncbi:MAG: GIY-YIG nuclease family protein, partial [bacterium]|nr:GIY-YIG nuclease family protein [bacterium]